MKPRLRRPLFRVFDVVTAPFAYLAATLLKRYRTHGITNFPVCRAVFFRLGLFPIRDHYYEPFGGVPAMGPAPEPRPLAAIDWNEGHQLEFLTRLTFSDELADLSDEPLPPPGFFFGNGTFESGDAEYLYNFIRAIKPRRVIEVGCGFSTVLIDRARRRNREEDPERVTGHLCIEPYRNAWIGDLDVEVRREKVEDVPLEVFAELEAGDLLFIDSSHVVRSGGDVLFEQFEILPALAPGVFVHFHDIFSPEDYPLGWRRDHVRLWTEQYLLEAFLSHNDRWRIIGALNYLWLTHPDRLRRVAPFLTAERVPGSFYIQKTERPTGSVGG